MKQSQTTLIFETPGPGLLDVTRDVEVWSHSQGITRGLLTLFLRHTSASLVIQENADPDVLADLSDFFARIAPQTDSYRHQTEGPDDMPAHIKSALTATQISVPVTDGRLALGMWQGVYLFEHRDRPHRRELVLHLIGE